MQPARPVGLNDTCWVPEPAAPANPTDPASPADPGVTIADVASFAPSPGTLVSEPAGWGVVGIDTNFLATARAQTKTGTLLGRPVQVRFTPTGYAFDYGDGSARQTTSAGARWAASGVAEFAPTATSHRYDGPGDYTVSLTVRMRADFAFDDGAWTWVPGYLDLVAPGIPIHIGTIDTYLVDHPCVPGSSAPGC